MNDLSIVSLQRLFALDTSKVLGEALHMSTEVSAELLDRLARLHDLLDFFA